MDVAVLSAQEAAQITTLARLFLIAAVLVAPCAVMRLRRTFGSSDPSPPAPTSELSEHYDNLGDLLHRLEQWAASTHSDELELRLAQTEASRVAERAVIADTCSQLAVDCELSSTPTALVVRVTRRA